MIGYTSRLNRLEERNTLDDMLDSMLGTSRRSGGGAGGGGAVGSVAGTDEDASGADHVSTM